VNRWAAEIHGGHEEAKRVAREHGYRIVKKVQFRFLKKYFFDKTLLFQNLYNYLAFLI
jgi:hypothetical protein